LHEHGLLNSVHKFVKTGAKLQKILHISKKSSNFVRFFSKKAQFRRSVFSEYRFILVKKIKQ